MPSHLCTNLILDKLKEPTGGLKTLLNSLKDRGLITDRVYQVMAKIDRKHFINGEDSSYSSAYSDLPRQIGWGTTISAPHMHGMTLEKLKSKLVPGAKCLDIGTGSGYLTACMAEMVGQTG